MVTDVQGKKGVWKKNEKNLVCETVVWSLADWVKNLIEKKWPGPSDNDMVTGGLKLSHFEKFRKLFWKISETFRNISGNFKKY